MKLRKLTLEGFKSYKDQITIDFTRLPENQIFLIVGNTGAGKSTILDAIQFALFGEYKDGLKNYEHINAQVLNSLGYLSSQKTKKNYLSKVELEFEYNGKIYTIKRYTKYNFKKEDKKLKGSIKSLQELDKEELLKKIKFETETEILSTKSGPMQKLPFFGGIEIKDFTEKFLDQFQKIVVIPQNRFSDFLKLKSDERADFLAKVFQLDFYEKFINFIDEKRKQLEKEIELKRNDLETILERNLIKKSIEDNHVISEFDLKIQELENQKKNLEESKRGKEEKKKNLSQQENEKKDEKKKIEDIIKDLNKYDKKVKEYQEKILSKQEEIKQKKEKIENARKVSDLYPIFKQIEKLENDIKKSQEEINAKEKEKQKKQKELDDKKKRVRRKGRGKKIKGVPKV
ncbi:MAG: AAA family ATPase [Leptospiraceae bacterium]|nr:AAA family ATPase [Leptospiraceae bacterium]MDW7975483.1 AAA family ATPase [Leptospiraceae bacterium]